MESALALVHQRFSTNTLPSWDRAHPYRFLAHNGEINTLRGNENWMHAREKNFASPLFGDDVEKIVPIINPRGSDSAKFDNALELLTLTGRSIAHAMMMMIPEAWQNHESMSETKRAFYEYHSCLMEPWDGPASIAFSDGVRIGAVLDRNGLRPSRYVVTKDGLVVMASEVGVLDIPPERIAAKGRLQPGRMFLVDTSLGRIVEDEEIKESMAARKPYRQWIDENLVKLGQLPPATLASEPFDEATLLEQQQAFGYTKEDLRLLMAPMAINGQEAVGSMGTDTPPAVLSDRPQLLFAYFKQLFAQVTNPAIDPLREELVMSISTTIGAEQNLFDETPLHCRQLEVKTPALSNEELEQIKELDQGGLHTVTLSTLFHPAGRRRRARARARRSLPQRLRGDHRGGDDPRALRPRRRRRPRADPRAARRLRRAPSPHPRGDTHALRPHRRERRAARDPSLRAARRLRRRSLQPVPRLRDRAGMAEQGVIKGVTAAEAVEHYRKAIGKGLLKVMSKMGISTLQSYHGAQIFEAVGLSRELIDKYFTWTASQIEGIGLEEIAAEVKARHDHAYTVSPSLDGELDPGGQYQWRRRGEYHAYNPETIARLQHSVRSGSYRQFKHYSALVNDHSEKLCTLRGLLKFKPGVPIPIEEVEPASEIVKRFKTGAMSLGSISREAHENLAIAMNRIGGKSNTGEGGEDPVRYVRDENGDLRRSAIKQVASGRFGVTSYYLVNADELQIKIAQGAKPGEGGQLPGHKVDEYIAKIRYSTPGVGLISPPPHHDIYSIEDIAQLIHDLKNANNRARVSVKLVSEIGVGTVAAGVCKAKADVVLISGYEGGHRRLAAHLDQARGNALGAGPRRDAAGAGDEQPARPHPRGDRRPVEDRPRRRDRRAARRRGVRLRDRRARRLRAASSCACAISIPARSASPRRTRCCARSSRASPSTSSTS